MMEPDRVAECEGCGRDYELPRLGLPGPWAKGLCPACAEDAGNDYADYAYDLKRDREDAHV